MTKPKAKIKTEKVRLPDEMMDELRKIKAKYLDRGEAGPPWGDLIYPAWKIGMAINAGAGEGQLFAVEQPAVAQSELDADVQRLYTVATEYQRQIVHQLLEIFACGDEDAIKAVILNVRLFYDRRIPQQS